MKQFCRKFCFECKECLEAKEQLDREEKIMAQIDGPIFVRTDEEKAALDCHGRP